MKRAVPAQSYFGDPDAAAYGYWESLKDAFDPRDFESLTPLTSPGTDAEVLLNQIVAILKG